MNLLIGWMVQGSAFRVEEHPTISFQGDFVLIVFVLLFTQWVMLNITVLVLYSKQYQILATLKP